MFTVSDHAQIRTKQRGLKQDDVHFVCYYGTETTNGYLLTEHDAKALEAEARYMLCKAERLRGVLVPVAGDTAKTVFHSSRKQQKRLLPSQDLR